MFQKFMKPFLYLCIVLLSASLAEAREWTIVGPRALGMGGAGVAVANDATASYWNPAAFGFFKNKDGGDYGKRKWSAVLDGGIGVQVHEDLGDELDKIFQIDFDNLNTGQIAAQDVSSFLELINDLKSFDSNENRALTISMHGGMRTQFGRFGIGGYAFSDISARGDLDLVNVAPVSVSESGVDVIGQFASTSNFNSGSSVPSGDYYFSSTEKQSLISEISSMSGWDTTTATNFVQAVDYGLSQAEASGATIPSDVADLTTSVAQVASDAETGGSLANNTSRLLFKGIALGEFPITYGHPVTDDFAVGASLKYMKARVYNTAVTIFDTDFGDALSAAKDDYVDSSNFGVDVGALYRFGDNLRIGIVGRNINSPKFDMNQLLPGDEDNIEEKMQVRAGIAYKPLNFVTLALDYDVTENDTTISDSYKSRNIAGGVELNVLRIVQLRAGAYKNIAESDIGLVYTAGLGVNLWAVNVDFGASLSPETTSVDGNDIPKEFKAALALSALF